MLGCDRRRGGDVRLRDELYAVDVVVRLDVLYLVEDYVRFAQGWEVAVAYLDQLAGGGVGGDEDVDLFLVVLLQEEVGDDRLYLRSEPLGDEVDERRRYLLPVADHDLAAVGELLSRLAQFGRALDVGSALVVEAEPLPDGDAVQLERGGGGFGRLERPVLLGAVNRVEGDAGEVPYGALVHLLEALRRQLVAVFVAVPHGVDIDLHFLHLVPPLWLLVTCLIRRFGRANPGFSKKVNYIIITYYVICVNRVDVLIGKNG